MAIELPCIGGASSFLAGRLAEPGEEKRLSILVGMVVGGGGGAISHPRCQEDWPLAASSIGPGVAGEILET